MPLPIHRLALAAALVAGCTVQVTPGPATPSARPTGASATATPVPATSQRPGAIAARLLDAQLGLRDVPVAEHVTIDNQAELAAYYAGLGRPLPAAGVDFASERVLALYATWACHGFEFSVVGGEIVWAERVRPDGPVCAPPLAEVVNLYVLPRAATPVRGARPYADAVRNPRPASPRPSATPTAAATTGPFPTMGFPERNPAAWPTTRPDGAFNFNGVWARVFNGESRAAVAACGERWERYSFQDPGDDGRDVFLQVDAVAAFVGFAFMHGELVGNRAGEDWVFTGTLTIPGPADGPEDHAYVLRLRPDPAGRLLTGTATLDGRDESAIRLAPAEVTGTACPPRQ